MNRENNAPVYTVSEINQQIRHFLEDNIAPLWLSGEISNFVRPSSGHWYFTLKDDGAYLRCAFFKPFSRGIKFLPQNGMQALIHGSVSLYEARGEYQFIADYIEPAGDGLLQQAFNRLKEKLSQEGLFDEQHKKTMPLYPDSIGIITSPAGAVLHDIIHVLKKRFPLINIILYPASVQGVQAPAEIISAIETANNRRECEVIILGRGGGSLEDLLAFNDENVARAIFNSHLPIVSAVGHEVDFTIADFVADQRAPTPSAAAALISPDQEVLIQQLEYYYQRIKRYHPDYQLQKNQQQLDNLEERFLRIFNNIFKEKKQRLIELVRALNALNPLSVLERGFAIVYQKDDSNIKKYITHTGQIKKSEKIAVKLKDGKIYCVINKVCRDKNRDKINHSVKNY